MKTNLFHILSLFLRVCIFLYVFYPPIRIKLNNKCHIYVFYPTILTRHIHKRQERVDELTENRDLSREMLSECQRIISTQQLKLLGEVPGYDLYYSLTHPLKWTLFGLETCTSPPHYLVLDFYQINRGGEIRTRNHLVIRLWYHVKEPS